MNKIWNLRQETEKMLEDFSQINLSMPIGDITDEEWEIACDIVTDYILHYAKENKRVEKDDVVKMLATEIEIMRCRKTAKSFYFISRTEDGDDTIFDEKTVSKSEDGKKPCKRAKMSEMFDTKIVT